MNPGALSAAIGDFIARRDSKPSDAGNGKIKSERRG
jgi:hypothetical protein